jgi:HSP20 family protein
MLNKKMEDKIMNLIRWNNQPMLSDIFDDFERRFYSPFKYEGFIPAANIKENERSFDIEIAVPGMKKDDFKINLENNILTVSTEKEEEKNEENKNYTRKEFMYGSFSRSFTLPKVVETEQIKASYENGILSIQLPKKDEAKISKQITIA